MTKIIVNPKRKKRIKELVDKNHEVMDRFYELATEEEDEGKKVRGMLKLIKETDAKDGNSGHIPKT